MNDYRIFYESLNQPNFAPAAEVFGLAWGILYPMIIAAGLYILVRSIRGKLPATFFGIYLLNLFFNLLFSPVELSLGLTAGTGVIVLVLTTLVWLLVLSWRHSQLLFWWLVPYGLWVSFATVLQFSLLFLN